MRRALWILALTARVACAQVQSGELRLHVLDVSGATVVAQVELSCAANGYDQHVTTGQDGELEVQAVPYGLYELTVSGPGLGSVVKAVEIRSALPVEETVRLAPASVLTRVEVVPGGTLVDPGSATPVMRMGMAQIQQRVGSLPGRTVQDLVVSEPGWLYEGNAVLHPRGVEYETQFVVDGIPLTDNRSPGSGPEINAEDLESVAVYTAGIPAEYGRKLGGVVELESRRPTDKGTHGQVVLSGGSYATVAGYADVQEVWGKSAASLSASGSRTSHYLNPVVPENYTNRGTTGDFAGSYERDLSRKNRVSVHVRHELARFEIPNELPQEEAGQLQTGDGLETMGTVRFQRIVSPETLIVVDGMGRETAHDLESNTNPTPIAAFEHNWFREGYGAGTLSHHWRAQEFKAGVMSDARSLHERFSYRITDPTRFDPGTPQTLPPFVQQKADLEQAAFVEDVVHAGAWTVSAGLRWDHYQLLVNENAFSPRLAVGRYVAKRNVVLHASYDRVFDTPSANGILISSSAAAGQLDARFLHLPVKPSRGNYYEAGLTKGWAKAVRADVNVYRRDLRNFADDNQLLNTDVSYPISFARGRIYGAEGKLTAVSLGRFRGYASYSYMVGTVWLPVTGGLFLGDDAAAAANLSGRFADSQDQRHTVSTRVQYQAARRVWVAAGASYGSGLPFVYGGTEGEALAEYGTAVVGRLNFARGRVRPWLSVNSSVGWEMYRRDKRRVSLQADGENLNDRLNVIDFGGLFSGNAIGPARSVSLRLRASF